MVPAADSVQDSTGTSFRLIEGGRYIRGFDGRENQLQEDFPVSIVGQYFGNAETPAHACWLTKPFYFAETEVTVAQFRAFVKETGYQTSAEQKLTEMVGWAPTPEDEPLYKSFDFQRSSDSSWKDPGFPQEDDHPVVGVSYLDAKAYCQWLTKREEVVYRLPTEAEWEYVCRAGSKTHFSFGDKPNEIIHRHGNVGNVELEKHRKHSVERQWLLDWDRASGDGHVFTAPVGSYEPNGYGIKDMHGNVWEWCEDLWLDTVYNDFGADTRFLPRKTAIDPVNLDQPQTDTNEFRVIRGGSWYNGPIICRSSNRTGWDADDAACYVGFRVVREANPEISTQTRKASDREQAALKRVAENGGTFSTNDRLTLKLTFSGEAFDESVLDDVRYLPEVIELRLSQCGVISQKGIEAISRLDGLMGLEFETKLDTEGIDFSALSRLPSLKSIHLPRQSPIQDAHLLQIAQITTLESLKLYGTDGGVSDDGLSALAACAELQLLHAYETHSEGRFLAALKSLPLTSLELTKPYRSNSPLADEYLAALGEFPSLQNLRLHSATEITKKTVDVIGGLPVLRTLALDGCTGIETGGFAGLGNAHALYSLNLLLTQAGDSDLQALGQLPLLARLSMGSKHITDAGAVQVANMLPMEYLSINRSQISDDGLVYFSRIPRLKQLHLQSSKLNGDGAKVFIPMPNLGDLKIISPLLTDVVFEHLSRCKSVQKLRFVERGQRPPVAISNAGIAALEKAHWLKEIWLPRNDTGVTEEAIKRLDDAMPKTGVIAYTVDWDRGESDDD